MLNGDHRNGDMPNTGQRGLYEGAGMQIKPRQHLLDIWQAMARHSFDDGKLVRGTPTD